MLTVVVISFIPQTEGTYVAISKYDNSLIEDRTESYRVIGLKTECTGD